MSTDEALAWCAANRYKAEWLPLGAMGRPESFKHRWRVIREDHCYGSYYGDTLGEAIVPLVALLEAYGA